MMSRSEFDNMELEITFEHWKDRLLYWINTHDEKANFDELIEFDCADSQPGIPDGHMRIEYVGYSEHEGVSDKSTIYANIEDWVDALYM